MSIFLVLTVAAAFLAITMAGAWALQRATHNCGWVDAVWSGSTGLAAAVAALIPAPGGAIGPRAWVAAAMAGVWGLRLAWHITRRTPGAPEDPRYAAFRVEWGDAFEQRLFSFLMIQAACAWVLVATVALAARNPAPALLPTDYLAIAVLAVSVAGEAVADAQMQAFRARRTGGVCDTGLWGYSRHPNYFFEFLAWCAYPLLAIDPAGTLGLGYPAGLLTVAGPALMFVLLRYVSGVPPLEKSMLARRGAAFAEYQARVSPFFPMPPRTAARSRTA